MFRQLGSLTGVTWLLVIIATNCQAQSEQIPVLNKQDVTVLRQRIQDYLWGDEASPQVRQIDPKAGLEEYYYYNDSAQRKYLGSMEVFEVTMKYGFTSIVYLLHPVTSNGAKIPVIYNSGHAQSGFREDHNMHNDGGPYTRSVFNFFLSKGYDVIISGMPMCGANAYPDSVTENGISYPITVHDDLFNLKKPYYYFLAPLKAIIDYLEIKEQYQKFYMVGFSGGGWTTSVYSAIDTRVEKSFQVAGSLPVPYRLTWSNRGDKEQIYWDFYDRFNYSTLYFLASEGKNRMSLQVTNKYDNCCFAIDGSQTWTKDVQQKLSTTHLPGQFHFYFDTYATWHRLSSVTADTIFSYFGDHDKILSDPEDEKYIAANNISVYPNPASTTINVNINNYFSSQYTYTITNINGVRIKAGTALDDYPIYIQDLPRGLYVIHVESGGKLLVQKFWVK